jgi:hypothetical protein
MMMTVKMNMIKMTNGSAGVGKEYDLVYIFLITGIQIIVFSPSCDDGCLLLTIHLCFHIYNYAKERFHTPPTLML